MRISVIGPPGSGKSTQAEVLVKRFNLPYVYLGKLFREEEKKGTELGQKVHPFIEAGELVPDDLVITLFFQRVKRADCQGGFIVDGVPRTIYQVRKIEEQIPLDKVIYVGVSLKTAKERLLKRGREDDTEGAITNRFKRYVEITKPILEFYGKSGRLVEVDGEGTVEEVKAEIFKKLGCQ